MNDNDDCREIPAKFFQDMAIDEFKLLLKTDGVITGKMLDRLWRLWGCKGKKPKSIKMMVSLDDLMRVFPPRKTEKQP